MVHPAIVDAAAGTNNGFLACSEGEFLNYTRVLFRASPEERAAMQARGLATAKRFDDDTFRQKFITAIFRGFLSLSFRHYVRQLLPALRGARLAAAAPERQVSVQCARCAHTAVTDGGCRHAITQAGRACCIRLQHSLLRQAA